jgi:hypothetical protein
MRYTTPQVYNTILHTQTNQIRANQPTQILRPARPVTSIRPLSSRHIIHPHPPIFSTHARAVRAAAAAAVAVAAAIQADADDSGGGENANLSQAALVPSISPPSWAPAGYQLLRWWGADRWWGGGDVVVVLWERRCKHSAAGSSVSGSSACTHERQGAQARVAAQADKSSGAATVEMIRLPGILGGVERTSRWRGTPVSIKPYAPPSSNPCTDCIHCVCMIDSLIDLTLQLRVLVFVQISDWSLHGGINHLPQIVHITSWRRRDTGTEVRLRYHPSPPSHSCFPFVNLL